MTHAEVLTNAIRESQYSSLPFQVVEIPGVDGLCIIWEFADGDRRIDHMNQVIYSHEFAKGLWPRLPLTGQYSEVNIGNLVELPTWKTHLQQMVIADDPIQYIKEKGKVTK